jgi:hypothetical protein
VERYIVNVDSCMMGIKIFFREILIRVENRMGKLRKPSIRYDNHVIERKHTERHNVPRVNNRLGSATEWRSWRVSAHTFPNRRSPTAPILIIAIIASSFLFSFAQFLSLRLTLIPHFRNNPLLSRPFKLCLEALAQRSRHWRGLSSPAA